MLHRKEKNLTDWEKYDDELIPVLERFAKGVYTGEANENGRPGMISMRLIDSELNLSKCAENQTRRTVWAYNKLKSEGKKRLYPSDIQQLSGVNKGYIERVIPLLCKYTDKETEDEIKRIFEKKKYS